MDVVTLQAAKAAAAPISTWKAAVRVVQAAASVTISNPGTNTFDGVALNNGDRLLLVAQTGGGITNGVYIFNGSASPLTRSPDMASTAQVATGLTVFVSEGTKYAGTVWRVNTAAPITLGTTGINFTAIISSPGGGTNSEHFGALSLSAGSASVAIGRSSSSAGASSTALGYAATASGTNAVSIGNSSAASGGSSMALGTSAIADNTNSTTVGVSATGHGSHSVTIGNGASTVSPGTLQVAIGDSATCAAGTASFGENVALGANAQALEWRCTAVGYKAQATAVSATAVGRGAYSPNTHGIALGRGAWTNANDQLALGFSGGGAQVDVYFDSGHTSKFVDTWADNSTISIVPSATPIAIHGHDALDVTGAPTNNVAGGDILLCGGAGTGTAVGGSVRLQVAPAGGSSTNTKNALVDVVVASVSGTSATLGFYGVTPVARQLLATGASHTVDDVITALQGLGLVRQS